MNGIQEKIELALALRLDEADISRVNSREYFLDAPDITDCVYTDDISEARIASLLWEIAVETLKAHRKNLEAAE